eukprot:EG_transcript_18572
MYPPYAGWAAVYEGGHPAQYHGQWWNRRHQGQGQGQGPPQQVPVWPALPYASHAPPPYPYPVEGPAAAWQRTAPPLPISWQSGGDQTRGVAPARWPSTTHMTDPRRPPPESWAGSESPPESRGTDASRGGEGPALPLPLPPVITAKSRDRLVLQHQLAEQAETLAQLRATLAGLQRGRSPTAAARRARSGGCLPPLREREAGGDGPKRAHSQQGARPTDRTVGLHGTLALERAGKRGTLTRDNRGEMARRWGAREDATEFEIQALVQWVEQLDYEHYIWRLEKKLAAF